MVASTVRRIFWPVNAAKGRESAGWVVGWMNSENDYFVFAVLNEDSIKVNAVIETDSRLTLPVPILRLQYFPPDTSHCLLTTSTIHALLKSSAF
jgi:hypothetical protein